MDLEIGYGEALEFGVKQGIYTRRGSVSELEQLRQRVQELEKIIEKQQFIEDRYEELMLSARRCWRYYGADAELFNASLKAMDFLIRRHATEIDEMEENENA